MGSKEGRRARLREIEAARERDAAITTPRMAHDAVSFPGVGCRAAQLLVWEAFQPLEAWEIYDAPESGLAAFYSRSESDTSDLLVGFEPVSLPSAELREFVDQLDGITVPLVCPPEPLAVMDGCWYEVAVFGGVQAGCRIWWERDHPPNGWAPLANVVVALIDRLRSSR
jgi:hypothetical protein